MQFYNQPHLYDVVSSIQVFQRGFVDLGIGQVLHYISEQFQDSRVSSC